ncbi:hypothetical protein MtrunA17_Chr7g0273751 [Medicago truncatula]|uniref:Uncharacterized protein n=1 Tax=Medicago truncatula TaxID=3880 RepID=A0A396H7Y5_MEDTR|nr:hypothetical protein MtrunA17_Chr7g0273751 [Medicago truncatula]
MINVALGKGPATQFTTPPYTASPHPKFTSAYLARVKSDTTQDLIVVNKHRSLITIRSAKECMYSSVT